MKLVLFGSSDDILPINPRCVLKISVLTRTYVQISSSLNRVLKVYVHISDSQINLHTPVVVVHSRSIGLPVFVLGHVLGELCTQCHFLPLLFPIVRCPWYLLWLLRTIYCLQLLVYLWEEEGWERCNAMQNGVAVRMKERTIVVDREKENKGDGRESG